MLGGYFSVVVEGITGSNEPPAKPDELRACVEISRPRTLLSVGFSSSFFQHWRPAQSDNVWCMSSRDFRFYRHVLRAPTQIINECRTVG